MSLASFVALKPIAGYIVLAAVNSGVAAAGFLVGAGAFALIVVGAVVLGTEEAKDQSEFDFENTLG